MKTCSFFIGLLLLAQTAIAQDMPNNIRQLKDFGCELADSSLLKKVIRKCRFSKNRGKSVAVFGGSLSVNRESQAAKLMWREYLNMQVTDYGHGGYGFSSLQGSILDQVNRAKEHDIYILWASTNDYTNNREPGTPQDYTEADGFDKSKSFCKISSNSTRKRTACTVSVGIIDTFPLNPNSFTVCIK